MRRSAQKHGQHHARSIGFDPMADTWIALIGLIGVILMSLSSQIGVSSRHRRSTD